MTTDTDATIYDAITDAHGGGLLMAALDAWARSSGGPDEYRAWRLAGYVEGRLAGGAAVDASPRFPLAPVDAQADPAATTPPVVKPVPDPVLAEVTELVAGLTGYGAGMLDPDLDFESDLGIDSFKVERIVAAVAEKWSLTLPEDMKLGGVSTLRRLAELARG